MNKKKEGLFKGASVAELYSKFGVVLILILCLIIGTILSPEFLTGSNLMSVARNVASNLFFILFPPFSFSWFYHKIRIQAV